MGSSLVLNRRPKVPAEDTAAFGAIAERFRRAGALEQAVSLCRDGLKKFPDHVSARVTLGWSLLDLGKYDEARVELEQVMRRAPDNLAAIRGLAELHDRFEHTLNLPMDGPGQWPPPADTVDSDTSTAEADEAGVSEQFKAEVLAEPAMSPAEMGLPLWTPGPATSTPEVAPTPVAASHSGMSSVREIDPFAGAPVPSATAEVITARDSAIQHTREHEKVEANQADEQIEIDAPVVAVAAHAGAGAEDLGVTDDALAALIAEAESLDAAAVFDAVGEKNSLDLGDVELQLGPANQFEPSNSIDLEAAVESGVELESPVELASAIESEPVIEPEAVVEPEMAVVEPQAIVAEPEASEFEPEAAALESPSDVAEPPAAVYEPAAAVVEAQVAASVAEVIAFARPAPALESVEGAVDAISAPAKSAATVVALERMLRRVQVRRRQLMTESVA